MLFLKLSDAVGCVQQREVEGEISFVQIDVIENPITTILFCIDLYSSNWTIVECKDHLQLVLLQYYRISTVCHPLLLS